MQCGSPIAGHDVIQELCHAYKQGSFDIPDVNHLFGEEYRDEGYNADDADSTRA